MPSLGLAQPQFHGLRVDRLGSRARDHSGHPEQSSQWGDSIRRPLLRMVYDCLPYRRELFPVLQSVPEVVLA